MSGVRRVGRAVVSWRFWVRLVVLVGLVLCHRLDTPPFALVRANLFDAIQRWLPEGPNSGRVVMVDVDERTIQALGQWPWPRVVMADLARRLTDAGATAGFDVLFAEPDRLSPDRLARVLSYLDANAVQALNAQPNTDAVFAAAMRGRRVVLGANSDEVPAPDVPPKATFAIIGGPPGQGMKLLHQFVPQLAELRGPIPELATAAAGIGGNMFLPDIDGTIRTMPLLVSVKGRLYPTMPVEVLRVAARVSGFAVRLDSIGIADVIIGSTPIPTGSRADVWPRFRTAPLRHVSLIDVIAQRADLGPIEGKIMLIGTTATGLRSVHATPIGPMLGDEIIALVTDNMLGGALLERPGWTFGVEFLILLAGGLVILIAAPLTGPRGLVAVWAALAVAELIATYLVALRTGMLLDTAAAVVVGLLLALACILLHRGPHPVPAPAPTVP